MGDTVAYLDARSDDHFAAVSATMPPTCPGAGDVLALLSESADTRCDCLLDG